MPKKEKPDNITKIVSVLKTITTVGWAALKFIIFLFFAMILLSAFGSMIPPELEDGNIAIIPIEGVIVGDGESTFTTEYVNSKDIVELIEKADKNERIKAIMLEINSPGGTPVASDEIAQAVLSTNKTTVAVIRETGASGAYWIATAADKIYAHRMSITGSIGVTASRLEFGGLLDEFNVTYRRLVAGKYKDAGSQLREMTKEEQKMYQQILDKLHDEFIKTVAENRNLDEAKVRELATGFVYLGSEAKELGLVDELGGKKEAIAYLENELGITAETVEYEKKETLFDELAGITSNAFYNMGRGIVSVQDKTTISFT